MAATVYQFRADIERLCQELDASIPKLIKLIALDIANMVVEGNPVDTGYSRSQWRIGINAPDTTVSGTRPRNAKGQYTTITAPQLDITRLSQLSPNDHVFVTNSVDYVQFLEEGTSQQAPNGFIRLSVAQAEAKVRQYLERV